MIRRDVTGQKFGRWSVGEHIKSGYYFCTCECGTQRKQHSSNLIRGNTKSCGCLRDEMLSKRRRDPRGYAGRIYNWYIRNAQKWGRAFNISYEDFANLIMQRCHYCHGVPSNVGRGFMYNGLDRIDNKEGYVYGNIIPACKTCNRMKDNLSYEEFLLGVQAVYKYMFEAVNVE